MINRRTIDSVAIDSVAIDSVAIDRAPHSLYLHVPFCVSKCLYCDFNSHVGLEGLFDSYNRALVTEIEHWGRELGTPRLDTVFIGGGTPSRVPAEHIAAALDAVRRSFDLAPGAEVTLEANPQSADATKIEAWLAAGVNRLSLGIQSLDAQALGFLERAHDAAEALGVYRHARRAGFTNISCDLIFASPGLTTERWGEVLAEVVALGPDHVSAYELTPEPGTRLGADVAAGRTAMPGEDLRLEQYETAIRMLSDAGFERYEVSNWARPGRECRHNLAYWSGVPYAAAGAGGHAFVLADVAPAWLSSTWSAAGLGSSAGLGSVAALAARQWNVANPAAYISAVRRQGHAMTGHEWLDARTVIGDLMMMGLRRDAGVDLAPASVLYGIDIAAELAPVIDRLCGLGLLKRAGETVRATDRGMMILNRVVAEFLAGESAGSPDPTAAAVSAPTVPGEILESFNNFDTDREARRVGATPPLG